MFGLYVTKQMPSGRNDNKIGKHLLRAHSAIIRREYFAINENLVPVKYSAYTIIQSENFAVNETSITAKYSAYTIIQREYFAVNETLRAAACKNRELHFSDTWSNF